MVIVSSAVFQRYRLLLKVARAVFEQCQGRGISAILILIIVKRQVSSISAILIIVKRPVSSISSILIIGKRQMSSISAILIIGNRQ